MNLIDETYVGYKLTVHTMSGNKNSGVIVFADEETIKLTFEMPDRNDKNSGSHEMVVTIRQDCIESIGERSK